MGKPIDKIISDESIEGLDRVSKALMHLEYCNKKVKRAVDKTKEAIDNLPRQIKKDLGYE